MVHARMLGSYPLDRLALLNVAVVLSVVYVRLVIGRARAGWARLLTAAPLFLLNAVLPFLFDPVPEFVCRACSFLLLTWVANFKVLGLVIDRGPLVLPLTPLQLLLVYAWPLTPQQQGKGGRSNARVSQSAGSRTTLLLQSALKSVLLVAAARYLLQDTRLPVLVREFLQAFSFYWWLGSLMDGPGAVLGFAAGLPVAPHFDAPYLSASISEFWSTRWNLTVSNALRFVAYDPINEGCLIGSREAAIRFSKARSLMGVLTAFIISGIMHEVFLWYLDSAAPNGKWCIFFVIQGPLVIAESSCRKWCRRKGILPPRPVQIALTLLALLLMGHLLFFPPILDSGLLQLFYGSVLASLPRLGKA